MPLLRFLEPKCASPKFTSRIIQESFIHINGWTLDMNVCSTTIAPVIVKLNILGFYLTYLCFQKPIQGGVDGIETGKRTCIFRSLNKCFGSLRANDQSTEQNEEKIMFLFMDSILPCDCSRGWCLRNGWGRRWPWCRPIQCPPNHSAASFSTGT